MGAGNRPRDSICYAAFRYPELWEARGLSEAFHEFELVRENFESKGAHVPDEVYRKYSKIYEKGG